jgi:hypothetical protein
VGWLERRDIETRRDIQTFTDALRSYSNHDVVFCPAAESGDRGWTGVLAELVQQENAKLGGLRCSNFFILFFDGSKRLVPYGHGRMCWVLLVVAGLKY